QQAADHVVGVEADVTDAAVGGGGGGEPGGREKLGGGLDEEGLAGAAGAGEQDVLTRRDGQRVDAAGDEETAMVVPPQGAGELLLGDLLADHPFVEAGEDARRSEQGTRLGRSGHGGVSARKIRASNTSEIRRGNADLSTAVRTGTR